MNSAATGAQDALSEAILNNPYVVNLLHEVELLSAVNRALEQENAALKAENKRLQEDRKHHESDERRIA